jgi:predicted nuclease with TOPRIM domain
MGIELEQVYKIVDRIKIEIKNNINESLGVHFKFIDEKLNAIMGCSEDSEKEIIKAKDRIRELEFRMEKIENAQKQSDNKIIKLQDFFENLKKEIQADMKAIKNLVTPKRMSWPKIIGIIIAILGSPAVLLLIQAMLKANGWL